MANAGRPSKYDKDIKPHIEEITSAVESGATIEEVADAFGIAKSTLYKYKKEKAELREAFVRGRAKVIFNIKGALLKKALGYEYEEEKSVRKKDKSGESIVAEKYKRHMPPSETAAAMLLRNYDEKWIDRDNLSSDLRRQELELKKAIAESNNFDLDLGEDK